MDIVKICSVQSAQAMCNMRTIVWKLSITLAPMLYRKNLHSILWYPTTIIREKTFFIESVRVWYEKYKQNYKVVITIIWLWWYQVLEKVCVWISEQKRFQTYNLFTTTESPNIRIPILQIFVFIYWRGTRKHFLLVQNIFWTNEKCFLVPLQ